MLWWHVFEGEGCEIEGEVEERQLKRSSRSWKRNRRKKDRSVSQGRRGILRELFSEEEAGYDDFALACKRNWWGGGS